MNICTSQTQRDLNISNTFLLPPYGEDRRRRLQCGRRSLKPLGTLEQQPFWPQSRGACLGDLRKIFHSSQITISIISIINISSFIFCHLLVLWSLWLEATLCQGEMAPAMVAFALAEKESLPQVIQAGAYFLSDERDIVGPCNWLDLTYMYIYIYLKNTQTLKPPGALCRLTLFVLWI